MFRVEGGRITMAASIESSLSVGQCCTSLRRGELLSPALALTASRSPSACFSLVESTISVNTRVKTATR